MLAKSFRNRVLKQSVIIVTSRFSSSDASELFPLPKLTQSHYYHASTIPLFYHTIGEHLAKLANAYPNHECYVFKDEGDKRYTYKSFHDEVNSLSTSLINLGFQKGDLIGVWLPNVSENCAFSYAASKVGIIKVNINPAYLDRELIYCINKVGCKGLVMRSTVKTIDYIKILSRVIPDLSDMKGEINSKVLPTLKHVILATNETGNDNRTPQQYPKVMHLYRDLIRKGAGSSQDELTQRQVQLDGDTPIAIFYTSGTTGQPKAATLTNFNLLNCTVPLYYVQPEWMRRSCCPPPMFHIFGEVAGTLNINAPRYFSAFPAMLPDTVKAMRTVQEEKCTALSGSPIIFRDILHHPKRKDYDMSSLLFGIIGAAPVNPVFLEQLEREIPIKTLSQAYGQTENTGALVMSAFAVKDKKERYVTVGKAMPRMEMKIVDKNDQILPIGQEGEICGRGFSIMKCYFGDEGKTREAITPSGWLKTGDVGVMDEDGYIYYRSRMKEMIIVGGINVYSIEIENLLLEHPNIVEAQVFSVPDQRYGEAICAWIRLKSDTKINDTEEVRQFMSSKAAFFKVPKYVKIVESFASFTTPTGKVQKFKLTEAMVKELSSKTG